jgi:hypothetical protein
VKEIAVSLAIGIDMTSKLVSAVITTTDRSSAAVAIALHWFEGEVLPVSGVRSSSSGIEEFVQLVGSNAHQPDGPDVLLSQAGDPEAPDVLGRQLWTVKAVVGSGGPDGRGRTIRCGRKPEASRSARKPATICLALGRRRLLLVSCHRALATAGHNLFVSRRRA